jgi:hypothetical protein
VPRPSEAARVRDVPWSSFLMHKSRLSRRWQQASQFNIFGVVVLIERSDFFLGRDWQLRLELLVYT